jgi:glycosyltransferase involved in cell wall biosynthesis
MRILVLNLRDITNPAAGGAEEHLHQLFRRIASRGHAVTLHCGTYPGARREEMVEGIQLVRRGNRLTTAAWSIAYYLKARHDFDVVVDYTCQLHFLTPLYARLPRVAMALHVVGDVYRHDLPVGIGYLAAAWEALSLRLFYATEYFIAVCPSTAAELMRFGIADDRITVVRGGRREPGPQMFVAKTHYPSLVYHGRLKRYKRVDWLIRALADVCQAVPRTRLHVVGDGTELESLRRLVASLDLHDAVVFHGQLPDAEHWRIVSSAWVHVQPSMKEGWSLSVMEAAQLGIPTIASRTPGLQDVVIDGSTGLLFERDSLDDLSSRIIRLLRDADDRGRMGNQARVWANMFTWDEASLAVEEVLMGRVNAPRTAEGVKAPVGASEQPSSTAGAPSRR